MDLKKGLLGVAIASLAVMALPTRAQASMLVSEWFFGRWDCRIDGRPAQMQWLVVNDPQTRCDGDICSTTSGVKLVGRFSDNGSAWVPLAKQWSNRTDLGIRYLGREPDNWFLRYSDRTRVATGWTTWRGSRYPLSCWNRRP